MMTSPYLYIVLLYIPAIIVSGIITLLVWFIYNPKITKQESGDKQADSKTLFEMAKELQIRINYQKGIFSFIGGLLYTFGILYAVFLFGMFFIGQNELILFNTLFEIAFSLLSPYITFISIGVLLIPAIAFIFYLLLNALLNLLLMPFYKTRLKASLKSACEDYYYLCNPDAKEIYDLESSILQSSLEIERKYHSSKNEQPTEEEAQIREQARQIREQRNLELTELKKKLLHRNPIFTIGKIAIVALPLIFGILSINNIPKMTTLEIFDKYGVVYITPSTTDRELRKLKIQEILKNNMDIIEYVEAFEKLTPEQKEVLLTIGTLDFNNEQELQAFLTESGLYNLLYHTEDDETDSMYDTSEPLTENDSELEDLENE